MVDCEGDAMVLIGCCRVGWKNVAAYMSTCAALEVTSSLLCGQVVGRLHFDTQNLCESFRCVAHDSARICTGQCSGTYFDHLIAFDSVATVK